jgi:acyl-CoA thioester hydrolase
MGELRITHESTVTEDQIDHLGHMNVRFYAVNANAGTDAVLADLPGWDGRPHVVHDLYTRHHREQLLGTRLVVRSAVVGVGSDGLALHHELAASDSGELAATFRYRISPVDGHGERIPLPGDVAAAIAPGVVPPPAHAATRTISLDTDLMSSTPTLDTVVARGLEMRRERPVTAEECDGEGRYRIEMAPLLTWAGEPLGGESGPMLDETPDGRLMGWASMETRLQVARLPRVGDRIQSFGAGVAVRDKVTHRVHWAFDLERGELLTAFETVSMAFDIRARRPISIPPEQRARDLAALQPDLAPQALA